MTYDQIASIIRDASMAAIFAFLWWTERMDRKASERRERSVLREYAKLPGGDEENAT